MAIALVTSGKGTPSASSSAVTLTTTGANVIVVSLSSYHPKTGFTLTDSNGNTWTALTARNAGGGPDPNMQQFYCLSPIVGASHTFTAAATNLYGTIYVHAFSGVGAYESETGTTALSGTSLATGNLTPSANGAVLVAAESFGFASTESGAGTYTGFDQENVAGGVTEGLAVSYYIQPTAAAIGETFSGSDVSRAVAQCCFTAAATGHPASRRMGGVMFSRNQSLGMNRW